MKVINYLKRINGSGHIVEHVGWHESGDYFLRLLFETHDKPFRQHKYEVEKEYSVIDKSEVEALERQTCKARMSDMGPLSGMDGIDYWQIREGKKYCSYCGSMHPMDVIKAIKEKGFSVIERSDKSYKWYIDDTKKYYRYHDTIEFTEAYNSLLPKQP